MGNSAIASKKGVNWIKIVGIITLVGVIVAVARIVLRVFREKPDDHEHHEAA